MNFKKVVFSTLFLSFVFLFGIKVASADSININLRQGSRSGEVSKLQQFLIDEGYLTTAVTGTFGPKTALAVRAFQRDNGISQTGAIGPLTRGRINGPDFLGFCNGVTTPKIKVKKPNGGETYTVGGQINVKWRTCNATVNDQVMIILKSTQTTSGAEIATVPNTRTTTITVPTTLGGGQVPVTSGQYYKIRLELGGNAMGHVAPSDESDNLFTINTNQQTNCSPNDPPSIKVLSPNGGETWTRGQQATVTWTSCNVPATTQLRIDLSESVSSGAHTTSAPIIQSTPNDGSESFIVSNTMWDYFAGPVGYPFKIYIVDSCAGSGCVAPNDYSDNSFSIN